MLSRTWRGKLHHNRNPTLTDQCLFFFFLMGSTPKDFHELVYPSAYIHKLMETKNLYLLSKLSEVSLSNYHQYEMTCPRAAAGL